MNTDFIAVHAWQTAGPVAAALNELVPTPSALVICWSQPDAATNYYLLLQNQALPILDRAPAMAPLVDVFGLAERLRTPTVTEDSDVDLAPLQCVVLVGDRVCGVWHDRIPFLLGDRFGGPADIASAHATSHMLKASIPQRIAHGSEIELHVAITKLPGVEYAQPLLASSGRIVQLRLDIRHGFSTTSDLIASVVIGTAADTVFRLRADLGGVARLDITCTDGHETLAEITLTPLILEQQQSLPGPAETLQRPLVTPVSHPDLTLVVLEERQTNGREFGLRLSADDPTLGLNLRSYGTLLLHNDPREYFKQMFAEIDEVRASGNAQQSHEYLKMIGNDLFKNLLPRPLREALWQLRHVVTHIRIESAEPWIPWEILRLSGDVRTQTVEDRFLCEQFEVCRWLAGVERRTDLHLRRLALVRPTSELGYAGLEQLQIEVLAGADRQITAITPTYAAVMKALADGNYDWWHFIGHARSDRDDPEFNTSVSLTGDWGLTPRALSGRGANCGRSRPLVFLNACETGRNWQGLTDIGGWAKGFIDAGATAFIGTLWPISDQKAALFAQLFYQYLLVGLPIGRAVRQARLQLREGFDTTWLAYTVFADPLAALRRPL